MGFLVGSQASRQNTHDNDSEALQEWFAKANLQSRQFHPQAATRRTEEQDRLEESRLLLARWAEQLSNLQTQLETLLKQGAHMNEPLYVEPLRQQLHFNANNPHGFLYEGRQPKGETASPLPRFQAQALSLTHHAYLEPVQLQADLRLLQSWQEKVASLLSDYRSLGSQHAVLEANRQAAKVPTTSAWLDAVHTMLRSPPH